MSRKKKQASDVVPEGETSAGQNHAPRAEHDAAEEKAAEEAAHGEAIAAEELSEAEKAARLRALGDAELIAIAMQAVKADHWFDVAQRSQAELDNTIKRLKRESAESLRYAAEPLAMAMLEVVDNLELAVQAGKTASEVKPVADGVELTLKVLLSELEKHGVTRVEARGLPFDPAFHEAMMTGNDASADDNTVLQELKSGWKIKDRLLRAAKVSVNKRA